MTFAVRSWQRQSLVRVVISSWRAESSVSHSKFCDICGGFVATTKFGYARRVRVAISSWRAESSVRHSKFRGISRRIRGSSFGVVQILWPERISTNPTVIVRAPRRCGFGFGTIGEIITANRAIEFVVKVNAAR